MIDGAVCAAAGAIVVGAVGRVSGAGVTDTGGGAGGV